MSILMFLSRGSWLRFSSGSCVILSNTIAIQINAESLHLVVTDGLVQVSPGPSCSMTSLVATKVH